MFCEQCGSKLPDICVFCTNCGAKVAATPVTPVTLETPVTPETPVTLEKPVTPVTLETPITPVTPTVAPTAPVIPTIPVAQTVPDVEKKKFPAWINVTLFIFIILCLAILVAAFVLGKMASKDSSDKGDVIATSAKAIISNPKHSQTENLEFELGGTKYEINIPETEASIAGAEFGSGYIIENSDSEYLDYDYLIENYTAESLGYAYYEIYARYGVIFEDATLAAYFSSKTWYEPIMTEDEFIEDDSIVMNDFEVANALTIEDAYDFLY